MGRAGTAAVTRFDAGLASAALMVGTDGMRLGIIPVSPEATSESTAGMRIAATGTSVRNSTANAERSVRNKDRSVAVAVKTVVIGGRSRVRTDEWIAPQSSSKTDGACSVMATSLWGGAAVRSKTEVAACSVARAVKKVAHAPGVAKAAGLKAERVKAEAAKVAVAGWARTDSRSASSQ